MTHTMSSSRQQGMMTRGDSLADILERVLDTGIVIAGDIRVQLADIELLTIQIRLVICSVDRAQEMGMTWWKDASFLTGANDKVHQQSLEELDRRLERLEHLQQALLDRLPISVETP
jgi:hypothetical protein